MDTPLTTAIGAVSNLFTTAIDRIWPNPEDKAKAECMLMQAELEKAKLQMSVMLAEAQSTDKWTSRARPSFLYVVYTIMLFGIPISIAGIWDPEKAQAFITGFGDYLEAMPQKLYDLFTYVMLGYVTSRGVEKSIDVIKKK